MGRFARKPPPWHFNGGRLRSGRPGKPPSKLIRFCRRLSCRPGIWVVAPGGGGSKRSTRPGGNCGRFAGESGLQNFASPEAKFCITNFNAIIKITGCVACFMEDTRESCAVFPPPFPPSPSHRPGRACRRCPAGRSGLQRIKLEMELPPDAGSTFMPDAL